MSDVSSVDPVPPGYPEEIIEEYKFTNLNFFIPSIVLANSLINPILESGTPYWLVFGAGPGTLVRLHENTLGIEGPFTSSISGIEGLIGYQGNAKQAAFRLTGTRVVPEPSTIILLGTGLLGIVGIARRRES